MDDTVFIFRVDSSSEIGMGHLVRCIALAKALAELKATVVFICRDHAGSGHTLISDYHFRLHLLSGKKIKNNSSNPEDWLGCTQLHDALECSSIMSAYKKTHVIVDHYGLDQTWEMQIECEKMTVIDDLANREHSCDILIDQSICNTKGDYEDLVHGDFQFIGGNMVLLREEFNQARSWKESSSGKILVCMGGADPFGHTQGILDILINSEYKVLKGLGIRQINVIVGMGYADISVLEKLVQASDLDIRLLRAPNRVSEIMLSSDLCIVSCGTMILETCALGVPSVGVVVADNQYGTAEYLECSGAIHAYDPATDSGSDLLSSLSFLLSNKRALCSYSRRQRNLVSKDSNSSIARRLYES